MTPTLGRIIHVRPFADTTTISSTNEWWAAIIVSVTEPGPAASFSARAFAPTSVGYSDALRLLIAADEGSTWRWPPRTSEPSGHVPPPRYK